MSAWVPIAKCSSRVSGELCFNALSYLRIGPGVRLLTYLDDISSRVASFSHGWVVSSELQTLSWSAWV